MVFAVKFPDGREITVHAADAAAAKSKAFVYMTQPIYCCIHARIRANSNAEIGEMGLYFPPSTYPTSAVPMREVYMGGGYCLIPARP